jgi:hypothetical protein
MNEKQLKKLIYKINLSHPKTKFNMDELNEILKIIYYYHFIVKKEVLDQEDFIWTYTTETRKMKEIRFFYDYLENITSNIFFDEKEVKSLNYGTKDKNLNYYIYDSETDYATKNYLKFFEIDPEDEK